MFRSIPDPVRPAVLIIAALVVLAACSSSIAGADTGGGTSGAPGAGGGSREPDPFPADPGSPDDGVVGSPTGPEPFDPGMDRALAVQPEPGIRNASPYAFDRISFAADGRTATIYYYGGVEECYGLAGASIMRNEDGTYAVTVLEGARAAAADRACIEIALLKAVTVTLDEQLFLATGAAQLE